MSIRPLHARSHSLSDVAGFLDVAGPKRDVEITGISLSTQELVDGDLFVAVQGSRSHGIEFIDKDMHIAALLTDPQGASKAPQEIPLLVVNDPKSRLGDFSSWFYGKPFSSMTTVGITGTNGKTTTATLLHQLWRMENRTSGIIGTTGIEIAGESYPSPLTTPEASQLQALGAAMLERHTTHCVMEVSSHSLVQKRVAGIHFAISAFTNLTQDHLDFHKTMDAYFAAKSLLFTTEYSDIGFINIDDPYGEKLFTRHDIPMVSVSRENRKAAWHYVHIEPVRGGYRVALRGSGGVLIEGMLPLVGAHNLDNALMAIAIAAETGIDPLAIASHMEKLHGPAGRLEKIDLGQKFLALVDYAHSPDAVERVLAAVSEITPGRVIAVLGCGGDRDASKRPLMGSALVDGSDFAVMTSDNPRSEEAEDILRQMQGSHEAGPHLAIEVDRRGAIAIAVSEAGEGDSVVVLGKGHEVGQEIKGKKYPFDDRIELARAIENLG